MYSCCVIVVDSVVFRGSESECYNWIIQQYPEWKGDGHFNVSIWRNL